MPTPRYEQQVRQSAVPGARVSVDAPIEAFGGGQAAQQATNATMGLAEQSGKLAFQAKQKADDLATQDAWNQTVSLRQNLMMNPETGAMTKKGKNAFGVVDEYGGQFLKSTQKIEEGLANEDQRAMYRQMRTKEGQNLNESLQRHLFQESEQFDTQTTEATINNAVNDATLHYGEPDLLNNALNNIRLGWATKGNRNGWSPEMVQAATNKSLSAAHREVISRMVLNGQDEEAQDHYALLTGKKISGQVEQGNIDPTKRPVVDNGDGSFSTEKSFSVSFDNGKTETLIPQVVEGKVVSQKEAIEHYKKTGEHLGTFSSVKAANKYADHLHNSQENRVKGGADFTFDASDALHVDRVIEQGQALRQGTEAYAKVRGMKLPDGQPDEAKMRSVIYSDDSISLERKEKIWSFVKTRTSEDMANDSREKTARDTQFMNGMIKFRKGGGSLEEALRQASASQRDEYDGVLKAQIVQKIYAPPTEGDPTVVVALNTKIDNGTANEQEIDRAYTVDHTITDKQWIAMRQKFTTNITEGQNPKMKMAWEQVNVIVRQKIGSNENKRKEFLSVMHEDAQGKTPDEIVKMANDKFKEVEAPHWYQFNDVQWKVDAKRLNAKSIAFGTAHQDLGQDVVDAIGQGYVMKGNKAFTASDIDAFGQQLGGYDQIKKGTPANNAIQSLIRKKKPVTAANVKHVLSIKPDGKI